MSTFEIDSNQFGEMFIVCLLCGSKSFHPQDVAQEYCGSCHQFHEIMRLRRLLEPDWTPDAD